MRILIAEDDPLIADGLTRSLRNNGYAVDAVSDGMAADSALSEEIRREIFPNSRLKGSANLLVMPTLDAANIAVNMLKVLGEGQPIGPILLGAAKPVHILTPSVTARGVVNISAVATVDAQVAATNPG